MNDIVVLVPVKGKAWKSRLSPYLTLQERLQLTRLLLEDLLFKIGGAGLIADTYVVTSSSEVAATAIAAGARVISESRDNGVNAAVEFALEKLEDREEFLVLPGDLPFLCGTDISAGLRLRRQGMTNVVSPSARQDGTNLLLFPRNAHPVFSYDTESFWRHIQSAGRLGIKTAILSRPGVAFDVDSPSDLRTAARSHRHGVTMDFIRKVADRWAS